MGKYKKGQSGNPGGRPKGSKNKVNQELREKIGLFLQDEFELLSKRLRRLGVVNRMKFFIELLPYALPKLQSTSFDINFERMSDEDLDRIIDELTKRAADDSEAKD